MAVLDPKMDVFLRRQLRAMGTEYASLKKELKASLSTIFEKYADADGRVNYAELSKYGRLDKFRDEVKSVTSRYQTRIDNKIRGTSVDMYTKGYQGEMLKVKAIAPDVKLQTIPPIQFTTAAVQNDLSGMVLNERLREHRADIIRRINVDLTQGIHRGDTYGTMAKSISEVLEKDFVKSTRIVRTEGHRVYEQARNDAVKRVSEKTKHKMMKRWVSSKDERVRDSHIEMDGQEVPVDEDFVNPVTGGKGPHPGAMGTAEDDINCRCTMITRIVPPDENILTEEEVNSELEKELPPATEQLEVESEADDDYTEDTLALKNQQPIWDFDPADYRYDFNDRAIDSAVESYTKSGYTPMNTYLRTGNLPGGKDDPTIKHYTNLIRSEIERQKPVEEGKFLFRGIGKRAGSKILNQKIGSFCEDPAFQSFSASPRTASKFSVPLDTGENTRIVLRAITDGKAKALAGNDLERELIFSPGQKWQIISKEVVETGQNTPSFTIVTIYPA